MKILVRRNSSTEDAIFGTLYMEGNPFNCVTLENKAKSIPSGVYKMEFTYSPAFNRIMPLINVPGREGIRIHWANYPGQLEGCIAVATERDGDSVSNSRVVFNQLFNIIKDIDDLSIEIQDA